MIVRAHPLDRAHGARAEARTGTVADGEVHRYADDRDVEIVEAVLMREIQKGRDSRKGGRTLASREDSAIIIGVSCSNFNSTR